MVPAASAALVSRECDVGNSGYGTQAHMDDPVASPLPGDPFLCRDRVGAGCDLERELRVFKLSGAQSGNFAGGRSFPVAVDSGEEAIKGDGRVGSRGFGGNANRKEQFERRGKSQIGR